MSCLESKATEHQYIEEQFSGLTPKRVANRELI